MVSSLNITHSWFGDFRNFCKSFLFPLLCRDRVPIRKRHILLNDRLISRLVKKFFLKQLSMDDIVQRPITQFLVTGILLVHNIIPGNLIWPWVIELLSLLRQNAQLSQDLHWRSKLNAVAFCPSVIAEVTEYTVAARGIISFRLTLKPTPQLLIVVTVRWRRRQRHYDINSRHERDGRRRQDADLISRSAARKDAMWLADIRSSQRTQQQQQPRRRRRSGRCRGTAAEWGSVGTSTARNDVKLRLASSRDIRRHQP